MSEAATVKRLDRLMNEPIGETLLGKCARPRPRLVCVDGEVVGDAIVVVSEEDPNRWRGMAVRRNGEIRVKREQANRIVRRA
jgi:hypothetical protein